jgi:esterase/lipase
MADFTSFLFTPSGSQYDPGTFPHIKRNGIYICTQGSSSKAAIFLHGSRSNLSNCMEQIESMLDFGYRIYAPEYPGFNDPKEEPSEDGCYRAAHETIQQVLEDGYTSIDVFGYSMGSLSATWLANQYPINRLILIAAFTSFRQLVRDIGLFTEEVLNKHLSVEQCNNINRISSYMGPLFIFHGKQDKVIKPEHSKRLYEACSSLSKNLILTDTDHYFKDWKQQILPYLK